MINHESYCSECGTRLNVGVRFCPECGTQVYSQSQGYQTPPPIPSPPPIPAQPLEQASQQLDATNTNYVQEFKNTLFSIDSNKKGGKFKIFGSFSFADPADKKKLALIRNFSIPDSIEEIKEFILLSSSNIVANTQNALTKNMLGTHHSGGEVYAFEVSEAINQAWISKMHQAYYKAKMLFPNDKEFLYVEKVYFEKIKELNISIDS